MIGFTNSNSMSLCLWKGMLAWFVCITLVVILVIRPWVEWVIQKYFLPSQMSFNTQLQSWQGRRKIACWQGFLDQLRLKQGQKIILFQFFLFQSYFARSFPKKGFLLCEKGGSSSLDQFFFRFYDEGRPYGHGWNCSFICFQTHTMYSMSMSR